MIGEPLRPDTKEARALQATRYFEQIGKPAIYAIDVGVDSHVYLFTDNSSGKSQVCKVYDVGNLRRSQIEYYANLTNTFHQLSKEAPFQETTSLLGEPWNVTFIGNPIEHVDETESGIPFTISPHVPGKEAEQLFYEINVEERAKGEGKGEADDIELISAIDERVTVPFSKAMYMAFFNNGFWILNPDRFEFRFNTFINTMLGTTGISLHPKNIKPRIDVNSHTISLIVTDIEGTLGECGDIQKFSHNSPV